MLSSDDLEKDENFKSYRRLCHIRGYETALCNK